MTIEWMYIDRYDREKAVQKKYKRSYSVLDVKSEAILVSCDVIGHMESNQVELTTPEGQLFLNPNRKIMPSKWLLTDSQGQLVSEISRASVVKLMNPIGRHLLTIQTGGREFQMMNVAKSKLDIMFGTASVDWALMENKQAVAGFDRRKDPNAKSEKSGFLGKIQSFLTSHYWVILIDDISPPLSPSTFLSMMLVFEAHRDHSA